jgi:hypothetical protein
MTATLSRDFDEFLYASIGDDANGMPVTLLSALARLDVDPWEEAAKLARLSLESASKRLASQLTSLPNPPATSADSATIATRLVALLHRSPTAQASSPGAPPRGTTATPRRRVSLAVYSLIALICMLIGQWVFGMSLPITPAGTSVAPATPDNLLPHPAR